MAELSEGVSSDFRAVARETFKTSMLVLGMEATSAADASWEELLGGSTCNAFKTPPWRQT
ncbi:MAG: hypothetical protein ACKESB_01055 [Candidatus Hodgkinia cicadicola]